MKKTIKLEQLKVCSFKTTTISKEKEEKVKGGFTTNTAYNFFCGTGCTCPIGY